MRSSNWPRAFRRGAGRRSAAMCEVGEGTATRAAASSLERPAYGHVPGDERALRRADVAVADVLNECRRLAFSDKRDVVEWDHDGLQVKPSAELSDDAARAISEIEDHATTRVTMWRTKAVGTPGEPGYVSEGEIDQDGGPASEGEAPRQAFERPREPPSAHRNGNEWQRSLQRGKYRECAGPRGRRGSGRRSLRGCRGHDRVDPGAQAVQLVAEPLEPLARPGQGRVLARTKRL